MDEHRERSRILGELALLLEGEMARGLRFWMEPGWNQEAANLPASRLTAARPPAARLPEARHAARPPAARSPEARHAAPSAPPPATTRPSWGPPPPAAGREPDWSAQLRAAAKEASACVRCDLHKTRTHVVFNSGSGEIPLVFVGEAPGADEDAQGEAFVGRAGQLLTKIIAAIGLDRRDVYICNVLKCRPPGNRNPLPEEIASCGPFLARQLALLKPRAICALGLFAAQLLLDTKAPIGKLRGRIFRYQGIPLLPTYHPAALLRNPALKRVVWEDVQLLRRLLDGATDTAVAEVETPPDAAPAAPRASMGDLFS